MPKLPIDYSNTFFYKTICNDLGVPDIYVGQTTKFAIRKNGHKTSCNNPLSKSHNVYV